MKETTLETINRIFAETLKKPELSLSPSDTPTTIAGWDSLNHARIITSVEEAFQIQFRLKELASIRSISDLVMVVDSKLNAQD